MQLINMLLVRYIFLKKLHKTVQNNGAGSSADETPIPEGEHLFMIRFVSIVQKQITTSGNVYYYVDLTEHHTMVL